MVFLRSSHINMYLPVNLKRSVEVNMIHQNRIGNNLIMM